MKVTTVAYERLYLMDATCNLIQFEALHYKMKFLMEESEYFIDLILNSCYIYKAAQQSLSYCQTHRSVTYEFYFALGIKPSDITFCPCLTAHAKQCTIHPVPHPPLKAPIV